MTDDEITQKIAEGLQPAWRHGFADGLNTAARMVEDTLTHPELPVEAQGALTALLVALQDAQKAILDPEVTPGPEE